MMESTNLNQVFGQILGKHKSLKLDSFCWSTQLFFLEILTIHTKTVLTTFIANTKTLAVFF